MGYRAGAPLLYQDSIQYHPTGAVYPSQILGALVTEKVRSVGAQLVNQKEKPIFIHWRHEMSMHPVLSVSVKKDVEWKAQADKKAYGLIRR